MYCTVAMLRTALAPGSFVEGQEPSVKTNSAADMAEQQLSDAIAEADALIDSAIGGRYVTPVALVGAAAPSPIVYWSRNIAGYLATCTWRRSQDFTENDPVYRRYAVTMTILDAVAKGSYSLNIPRNDTPSRLGGASAPINPYAGALFDGSDLDLSGGDGLGWPYAGSPSGSNRNGHVGAVINPLESSTDLFNLALEGLQARPAMGE